MTSRTSGKPDPASDDLPAPEAARGAGERLAIDFIHARGQHLRWILIGGIVGALCIRSLGTLGQVAGVALVAWGLWNAWKFAQTFRFPAGTVVVAGDDVELPRGLCRGAPAKLALAPNATTIGGTSANVNVAAGATSFSFVAQALDSVGPVQVTAAALGFVDGTVDITLAPSGFVISTPGNFSVAVGAANRNIQICAALLNPITLNRVENATLRFGITPVSVGVASSNPAAGVIVGSPRSIAGNTSCTGSGAAGIQFDPLAVGVSSLSLGAVPGFSTPSNQQQITATVN